MSDRIVGLHRFYYSTNKLLLVASGTSLKYHDGATWQTITDTMSENKQTYFNTWGALDKVYITNGIDTPQSYDGTTLATLSAPPADTLQFLPYQDRLLSINGGDLTWSGAYDDTSWETIADTGTRLDAKLHGMVIHSATNVSAGYEAKVLLAGSNGMYLFSGANLTTPFTSGDYVVYPLATDIGCNAPRTMVWTPRGTMYLGSDAEVYLLPFGSASPIPISTKVRSTQSGARGLESIPPSLITNACAVYHDGFYMISYTVQGQSINRRQLWIDITRLSQDEDGHFGPWFGPMKGMSFSCFVVQTGAGDSGELLAGEADGDVGSYVYYANQKDFLNDDGTAIAVKYQTYFNPLGALAFRKDVHRIEGELLDSTASITVDFYDIDTSLVTGDTFTLTGDAIYWNENYWNEQYWSSLGIVRSILNISAGIQARRLSMLISHSSAVDNFQLYGLRAEAKEQNLIFAQTP